MSAASDGNRSRRLTALALACGVLAVLAFDLAARRQLGTVAGLTDEWIALGANLAVHGTLGLEQEPWLLRPPGYPAFIALPLALAGPPRVVTLAYIDRAMGLVYASQALALALTAVVLYLWLSRSLRPWQAAAAAVTLALNPMSVVLVGVLQYGTLHVLGIVTGLWLLDRALAAWPARPGPMALAGLAWGAVTLVRPVTLVLPPFVLLACLCGRARPGLPSALKAALVFFLASACVIAPWTARNYALSGRLVPVNLQGWANVWAATLRPLPIDPDGYRWSSFGSDLLRVQRRVADRDAYDLLTYVRFNAEFEREYRREALANLASHPEVYATNAVRTLWTLAAETSTVLLGAFELVQVPGVALSAQWFNAGAPQPFDARWLRGGFRVLCGALSVLSLAGLLAALRRRQGPAWAAVVVAAGFASAHAVAHFEFTYLYVKLPFLVILGFSGVGLLAGERSLTLPGGWRVDAADALATSIAAGSLALTAALLS